MKWTRNHMIRNIGSLALALIAGCGATDALTRNANECYSADRHLAKCGLHFEDTNACSENKDGPVRPTVTEAQIDCIKDLDCGELRGQIDGGTLCGAAIHDNRQLEP